MGGGERDRHVFSLDAMIAQKSIYRIGIMNSFKLITQYLV